MFSWRSHPDEGQLLRFCDGELPSRDASRIEGHVRGCWQCRTQIDDMRRIIGDYVHYRSDTLRGSIPTPPSPWTSLNGEFQRIRSTELNADQSNLLRRSLPWILGGLAALAAAAAAVVFHHPESRPTPPREEIREVEVRAPQPGSKRTIPPVRKTEAPKESIGPGDELQVIAALHRIGADLGDPIEVTRESGEILIRGAGLDPQRVVQLRASVATIPHVSFDFAPPAMPPPEAAPAVVESGRSSPAQDEIARQFPDRAQYQEFVDRILESSEAMMARAQALHALAVRFPPDVELHMSAGAVALLASIRNDHAAALTTSENEIESSIAPILRSLHVAADRHPVVTAANWQASTDLLVSSSEKLDQLIAATFATTTGTTLDKLSASTLATRLADALADLKVGITSFQALSADGQTRGGR